MNTRHNIGRDCVDYLVQQRYNSNYLKQIKTHHVKHTNAVISKENSEKKIIFATAQSFMNNSGIYLVRFLQSYQIPIQNVVLISDSIDLELGRVRIKNSGSAGGHNGEKSFLAELNRLKLINCHSSKELPFIRIRVGIGRGDESNLPFFAFAPVTQHVLGKFTREELEIISPAKESLAEMIEDVINKPLATVMTKYNTTNHKSIAPLSTNILTCST
jgi:PTH1 family peptidyl-tRNA hydrolase